MARKHKSRKHRRNPPKMTVAIRRKISRSLRRRKSRRSYSVNPPAVRSSRRSRRSHRSSTAGYAAVLGRGELGRLFSRQNLTVAGGAVLSSLTTSWVMKKFGASLPFSGSVYGRMAYKALIPVGAAMVVKRWSRPLAEGMIIGGAVLVINEVVRMLMSSSILGSAASPVAATGEYLDPVGEYLDPVGEYLDPSGSHANTLGGYADPASYAGGSPARGFSESPSLLASGGAFADNAWAN